MNFEKTNQYDPKFISENLMGPNSMKVLEELCQTLPLRENMRILDLGCGTGLTSIFLAKEYGATVYATDLWINPTENFSRIQKFGLEDKIIPIYADAHALPYAEKYFDALISVDAYHYFGDQEGYLENHLLPLIKKEGFLAVAMPGMQEGHPVGIMPEEIKPFIPESAFNFYSCSWWNQLWEKIPAIEILECKEMVAFKEAWQDWLATDHPYAGKDRDMIAADNGKYFNLVQLIAKIK